ncbi:MAG: NUDIX domain-containing protein [Candidatus Aenigmarchaeota archaeon]|nr:NUDIX domain-containing protein [Candidatus Aenigmarchaeota archaeon]
MDRPSVGIGVIVIRDGRFLLGWRRASHGSGTWCPPGGHLEFGETPEDCAKREVLEETGLRIKNIRFGAVTNDIFGDNKHYITLNMLADWESGEPTAMEPEKAERWEWFSWDNLPKPLFLSLQNLVKSGFQLNRF